MCKPREVNSCLFKLWEVHDDHSLGRLVEPDWLHRSGTNAPMLYGLHWLLHEIQTHYVQMWSGSSDQITIMMYLQRALTYNCSDLHNVIVNDDIFIRLLKIPHEIVEGNNNYKVHKLVKKRHDKLRGGDSVYDWWGPVGGQECPNGACVFRGLWTMTALAKSASSRHNSLSLSSRKGRDVVRTKGGQLLWQRDTKSWTSQILRKREKIIETVKKGIFRNVPWMGFLSVAKHSWPKYSHNFSLKYYTGSSIYYLSLLCIYKLSYGFSHAHTEASRRLEGFSPLHPFAAYPVI